MPYTIEELMQRRAVDGTPVQPTASEIKENIVIEQTLPKQVTKPTLPKREKNTKTKNGSQLMTVAKEWALVALMAIGVIGVAGAVIRLLMWMFGVC